MNIHTLDKGIALSMMRELKNNNLEFCLKQIKVLNDSENLISYSDITPWQRGGGETYISVGVATTSDKEIKFIAKALVSMATQPDQQLKNWNSRREFINKIGIKTPILFSSSNGTIYEEFIDDDFEFTNELSDAILKQLVTIAKTLDTSGFTTIAFSRDLRIKNNTLYYVDFGSDLGEPSENVSKSAFNHLQSKLSDSQFKFVKPFFD
jgi:hypothetical protein